MLLIVDPSKQKTDILLEKDGASQTLEAELHQQTSRLLVQQLPQLSWRCASHSQEAELQQQTLRLLPFRLCWSCRLLWTKKIQLHR